jgi:protein involved in polysaccharide export with SLBB domain
VRRIDVERQLASYIGRFIIDPVVHARALVRLIINGEVLHPGFYSIPIDALFPETLMSAGGPTTNARTAQVKILRNASTLYSPDSLRAAIARGATLAALDLQASDEIVVPRLPDPQRSMQIVGYVISAALAIFALTRVK